MTEISSVIYWMRKVAVGVNKYTKIMLGMTIIVLVLAGACVLFMLSLFA